MTAQVQERLILDGAEWGMAACPPVPGNHPRIAVSEDTAILTTACWRGYIGTWEIRDRHLYLAGIRGRFKLLGEGPLPAEWFSGTLAVPRGELLHYVHMGFESVYEQELLITVKQGIVVETRVIDNRGRSAAELEKGPVKPPPRGEAE